MKNDPDFGKSVSEKLREFSRSILCGSPLIFMAAASEEVLAAIQTQAISRLGQLKAAPRRSFLPYSFPPQRQRMAVCVEAASQETRMLGDFRKNSQFKGRYLPFLLACADKYLKPSIRYQGGGIVCSGQIIIWQVFFQNLDNRRYVTIITASHYLQKKV